MVTRFVCQHHKLHYCFIYFFVFEIALNSLSHCCYVWSHLPKPVRWWFIFSEQHSSTTSPTQTLEHVSTSQVFMTFSMQEVKLWFCYLLFKLCYLDFKLTNCLQQLINTAKWHFRKMWRWFATALPQNIQHALTVILCWGTKEWSILSFQDVELVVSHCCLWILYNSNTFISRFSSASHLVFKSYEWSPYIFQYQQSTFFVGEIIEGSLHSTSNLQLRHAYFFLFFF